MNEIIKKNGITFGIISGTISVLITTLIYIINIEMFVSWWVGLLGIAISIIISCILLSKTKKELNGLFSFKEAFTTYFISAIIAVSMSVIFNILLFNFIDPSLKETTKELILKSTVGMMQKFGAKTADINETIKKMSANDQFSVFEQLKGFAFSLIFSSILGLVLAAFFKTKTSQNE
jgi:hypothetical protein